MHTRMAWKITAVVTALLLVMVVASAYVSERIYVRHSRQTAQAMLQVSAEAIRDGIRRFMMNRNIEGMKAFVTDLSRNNAVFEDLRLMAHHSGTIVVSRSPEDRAAPLSMEDGACAVCHAGEEGPDPQGDTFSRIEERPGEERRLSVFTPVRGEPGCFTGGCHAGERPGSILGILQTVYSLAEMETYLERWNTGILVGVGGILVLSIIALRFLLQRFLGRPLDGLIHGLRAFAAGEMGFRFSVERKDEIGVLQETYNHMAERIQAQQKAIEDARDYLEGIVENSADLIISVDPEGRIQTFNRGAEEALGYGREEVAGLEMERLFVCPEERRRALNRLAHTDNVRNIETRFRAKDGSVRHVLLTLSRLRDREGNPMGTFGISKDVTREKHLQEQLIEAERFSAIGQAVTGIQHAIKNMMNALKGGAYLVRSGLEKKDADRVREGWAMVEEGIERVHGLARSMLDYARSWKPRLEETDLTELIARVESLFREEAQAKGVRIRAAVPPGPVFARCDPKMIHMALTDLVSNAMDACTGKEYREDETPEVVLRVETAEEGKRVFLEVEDNGAGMTEEVRGSLFTPFFSTKPQTGTGLGLAVTQRVIQAHGGSIQVRSEPDAGACFMIELFRDGAPES